MQAQEVLDFWFGAPGSATFGQKRREWFVKDASFDADIRTRFGQAERKSLPDLVSSVTNGKLLYALGDFAALPRAAVVVEDRYSALFKQRHARPAAVADALAEYQIRWPTIPITSPIWAPSGRSTHTSISPCLRGAQLSTVTRRPAIALPSATATVTSSPMISQLTACAIVTRVPDTVQFSARSSVTAPWLAWMTAPAATPRIWMSPCLL